MKEGKDSKVTPGDTPYHTRGPRLAHWCPTGSDHPFQGPPDVASGAQTPSHWGDDLRTSDLGVL